MSPYVSGHVMELKPFDKCDIIHALWLWEEVGIATVLLVGLEMFHLRKLQLAKLQCCGSKQVIGLHLQPVWASTWVSKHMQPCGL